MSESRSQKSQIRRLESHICGIMIICSFFGEHFKVFGISVYCFPLIICIILLLADNHYRIPLPKGNSLARIERFSFFLILFSTITLPFSLSRVGSLPYIKILVNALMMLIVASNITDLESFNLVMKYFLVGIIITAIASGYEIITGHHFYTKTLIDDRLYRMGRGSAFGFQINVNDNSSLISLCVFIPILFLRRKSVFLKLVAIGMIAVLVGLAVTINARLPVLALVIVAVEAVALLLVSRYTKGAVHKFIVGLIFFVALVLFFASFSATSFLGIISSSQTYQYDYARLMFIQSAFKTITPISFIFGNGSGVTLNMINFSIHSVLIELLCDYGIIVAISFILLIIRLQFSFADNIDHFSSIYFPCFATAFFMISFCSSSMLRIYPVWLLLVIVWKKYVFDLKEGVD